MKYSLALLLALGCSKSGGMMNNCSTLPGGQACFFPATMAAARTPCGDVTEYCDKTAMATPNLSCLTSPKSPPSGPAKVTLTGFVHVFSSGPDSNNVSVQVYDASTLTSGADPAGLMALGSQVATLDPTTQRACDADGTKGCSLPMTNGCTLPTCNDGLGGRPDDHKYCLADGGSGTCSDRLRWESRYSIANVPTNTQLVVRVSGPNAASDSTWATTVAFNVFLSTGDPACTSISDTDCIDTSSATMPRYQLNVSALSSADYVNIPTISGLSGGISAGEGAMAGEVHDCDNIRLGNVQVATTPVPDRFTYFNGNPVKTLPDPSRAGVGTDRLGLFAALNEKPGKVTVEAAGAGAPAAPLMSFGKFDAFVYPNTVTIVNVNGGKGTR